ncbi:hypothetical protein Zmor_008322 [Zophobas morio]|uniref:Uncharacterized protein n=1 Tax=Zophobas morio TaxID=2755281 RepID=A0AA38MMX3_9CUCU|nr:hypothetical protein Zmor_008322 [Zophobas morio]
MRFDSRTRFRPLTVLALIKSPLMAGELERSRHCFGASSSVRALLSENLASDVIYADMGFFNGTLAGVRPGSALRTLLFGRAWKKFQIMICVSALDY